MQRAVQRSKVISCLASLKKIKRSCFFVKDGLADIKIMHQNMKQQIKDKLQWSKKQLFSNLKIKNESKIDIKLDKQNDNPNSSKITIKSFIGQAQENNQNQNKENTTEKIQLFKYRNITNVDNKLRRSSVPKGPQYFMQGLQQGNIDKRKTSVYNVGYLSSCNSRQRIDTFSTSKFSDVQNKDLKHKIIQQLLDLKAIQRKQHLISKANERLYDCYSQNKNRMKLSSELNVSIPYSNSTMAVRSTVKVQKENKQNILNSKLKAVQLISEKYRLLNIPTVNKENKINNFATSNSRQSFVRTSKILAEINEQNNKIVMSKQNSTATLGKNNIIHCQSEQNQNQADSLIESQVTIKLEAPSRSRRQKSQLKCNNNHEYYSGQVVNIDCENLPHGDGNLVFCCRKMPLMRELQKQVYRKSGLALYEKYQFYNGAFANGKFDGYGTLAYKGQGQVKYVGEFKQGKRNGKGSLYCNGRIQLGIWKDDQFIKSL